MKRNHKSITQEQWLKFKELYSTIIEQLSVDSSVDDMHYYTGILYVWHSVDKIRFQFRYYVHSDVLYLWIPDIRLKVPIHYTNKTNSYNIKHCSTLINTYIEADKLAFLIESLHILVEKNKKLDSKFNTYIERRFKLNIMSSLSYIKSSMDGYGWTDYYNKIINNNPNIFKI
jgi:hypothetical protein